MKLLAVVLTFCSITSFAQGDEAAVKSTINQFFEGMRKSDSMLIKTALAPDVIFQTIMQKPGSQPMIETENVQEFITAVTKPHDRIYDERIVFDAVKIDAALAVAWTPYSFYVGTTFSHCGVDCFVLAKLDGKWKIQYIIDTRRNDKCL